MLNLYKPRLVSVLTPATLGSTPTNSPTNPSPRQRPHLCCLQVSEFRLSYNMLLNLYKLRQASDDREPEALMGASFRQFQLERSLPSLEAKADALALRVKVCTDGGVEGWGYGRAWRLRPTRSCSRCGRFWVWRRREGTGMLGWSRAGGPG
eukprot:360460-Chlamydomonas_euryale.AAC.4